MLNLRKLFRNIIRGRFSWIVRIGIVGIPIVRVGIRASLVILVGLRLVTVGLLGFSLLAGLVACLNRSLSCSLGALAGFHRLPSMF